MFSFTSKTAPKRSNLGLRLSFAVFFTFLFSYGGQAQFMVPTTGWDTTNVCAGILRDPGGTGYYPNQADGYYVIDPPGNSSVSVVFSQFALQYGDYVYLYDGVGTSNYIGSYTYSSLPANGAAITASSGAITIRFYSNYSSNNQGFTMSWSTGSTSAPTASFALSTSAPAFNTPMQFINTTSGGGTYLWEFGDGHTSTEANPQHAYTAAGAKQVRLIATNCSGTDTSAYSSLTVQAAPHGSVTPDTVSISVACGGSNSGSFTISNSASGNLNYNLALSQPSPNFIFEEDFENSSLGGFANLGSYQTTSFSSNSAPQGSKYLAVSGSSGINDGLQGDFTASQPNFIRYRMKSDSYTSYHGYFAVGDEDQYGSFKTIFFSYFRYNDFRIAYRQNGYTQTYYHSYNTGDWLDIEVKNIDFSSYTFDLYIDGALVLNGVEFVNSLSQISGIRIYNNYTANIGLDQVEIKADDLLSSVTFNPSTGNLSNGSNNVIFINADATNLMAGTYWLDFNVSSNDTALDGLVIPLKLEVTGTAQLQQASQCVAFATVYENIPVTDSVLIWNTGCDSLHLSSVSSSSSDISFLDAPYILGKDDSLYAKVQITATSLGNYTDTITISDADTSLSFCISAQAVQTPIITTDSSSYTFSHTGCKDSASFPLVITNTGNGALNWSTSSSTSLNITDDFEQSSINSSIWASYSAGVYVNTNCGIINGSRSLSFHNSSGARWINTQPINTTNGGTISFVMNQGLCDGAESSEGIYLKYSTDGGNSWVQINYNYISGSSNLPVSVAIPNGAMGTNVIFRLEQTYNTGPSYDHWLIDDFAIVATGTNQLVFHPDTGSIAGGGSDTLIAKVAIDGLVQGSYNFNGFITSNDPQTPVYNFTVTLNLTGIANIVTPAGCHSFDSTMAGTSRRDSLLIYNDGCADLTVSSMNTSGSEFSIISATPLLAPGDSTYLTVEFNPSTSLGMRYDTLVINSNDTTAQICLSGKAFGAPSLTLDTLAIVDTVYNCTDSVHIQRTLGNLLGQGKLDYKVGGESISLDLQTVLDTFKNRYTEVVNEVPNPYYFLDGITGNRIYDGGNDMYDYGNYLSTNLGSYLYYSNDYVTSSYITGTNGQYFTYKGSGIFLMAADLDGVSTFSITGGLGADGYGNVDGTVLNQNIAGKSYTGFVKRVYNTTYEPSVNHLVIIENDPSASHTFSTNTNYDDHTISGLSNVSRIYYLLYASTAGGYIDDATTGTIMNKFLEILHGSELPDWITVSPDSAVVATGDSLQLDIWLSSVGLSNGTHSSQITINTNDPANPSLVIPVQLTVNGTAEASLLSSACLNYSNIQQGAVATDTSWVVNTGCDTLQLTAANSSSGLYGISGLPLAVAPGDSLALAVNFSPSGVGTFNDTLLLANNDSTLAICVNGTSVGAPLLDLPVDTLEVEVNACKLIRYEDFKLENKGLGAMSYSLDFGGYSGSSQQTYSTNSASTTHNFSGVPQSDTLRLKVILHGDYDSYYERTYLSIDGTYNYGYVLDNNKYYANDTIEYLFWGTNVQNWTANGDLSFTLNNTYDVDGGTGSFHRVEIELSSSVNWVSVVGSNSGSVAAGASSKKSLLFSAVGLPQGSYFTNLNITTNAPGAPLKVVPVTMNVVSEPEIALSDTCFYFPQTLLGDTSSYQLTIFNDGCQPLNVSNIISTNNAFKVSPASGSIPVADSLRVTVNFVPTAINNFSASLLISNNDTNKVVCLSAVSAALPVADFLFTEIDSCLGQVVFTNESVYNSNGSYWEFGDGNVSNQSDPIHYYARPGTYKVRLRAINNAGFDTITKTVTVNPLYVNFSMTNDTVLANSTVSFFDSSMVPDSWTWNFGDGNSSTTQNPTHSFGVKGKYEISLTVTDARGCIRTIKKDLFVSSGISVQEFTLGGKRYELFPNPAHDEVMLSGEGIDWSRYEIRLFDSRAQEVYRHQPEQQQSDMKLSLPELAPGLYQLLIFEDASMKSSRSLLIK